MERFLGRHLMIKGEYADLVLSGRKRATVRLGRVVPRYDEVIIHGGGRPLCKARIVRVTYRKAGELTEEDARKDGFNSLGEFYKALKKVYGSISPGSEVTILEFQVERVFKDLDHEDPYLGLDPVDVARIALRYLRRKLPERDAMILEEVIRSDGIRGAALKPYSTYNLRARNSIRRALRRALKALIAEGLIGGKPEDREPHNSG